MNGLVSSRGQPDAAFETTLRKLKAMDGRGSHLGRIGPAPRDDEFSLADGGLDLVGLDAGQGDENEDSAVGLEDVDGWLPGDRRPCARRREELPVHPLGALEHFERL